ncbi:MAG: hypothetical protein P4L56_05960 [Candidatus Sulfopaludibacter sp.]|nr:hypothetical protein [Candidatus Sulfopaludibacter sp.]
MAPSAARCCSSTWPKACCWRFLALSPAELPRIGANGSAIALDGRVMLFTVAVSALLAVVCSLVPALHLVKDGIAQASRGSRRQRWRSTLTIAEMAVSLVLLTGAGMMIRTLVAKRAIGRGFDERNVLTVCAITNTPPPRFRRCTDLHRFQAAR